MNQRYARKILKAMWADIGDDQIVAMPRSLFNYIVNEMGIAIPDTPITIFTSPPKLDVKP